MIFYELLPYNSKSPPVYEYTGKSEFIDEGNGNWKLKLTSSGTLTISKIGNAKSVDIFAVGGGKDGFPGERTSASVGLIHGSGGKAGECKTVKSVKLERKAYAVTIGTGEQNTSFAEIVTARTGEGALGGFSGSPGEDGRPGSPEFGEEGETLYAGGGGGALAGQGGPGGGGPGSTSGDGFDGTMPGAGGGGGSGAIDAPGYPGGKGQPGIIIIRNAR